HAAARLGLAVDPRGNVPRVPVQVGEAEVEMKGTGRISRDGLGVDLDRLGAQEATRESCGAPHDPCDAVCSDHRASLDRALRGRDAQAAGGSFDAVHRDAVPYLDTPGECFAGEGMVELDPADDDADVVLPDGPLVPRHS